MQLPWRRACHEKQRQLLPLLVNHTTSIKACFRIGLSLHLTNIIKQMLSSRPLACVLLETLINSFLFWQKWNKKEHILILSPMNQPTSSDAYFTRMNVTPPTGTTMDQVSEEAVALSNSLYHEPWQLHVETGFFFRFCLFEIFSECKLFSLFYYFRYVLYAGNVEFSSLPNVMAPRKRRVHFPDQITLLAVFQHFPDIVMCFNCSSFAPLWRCKGGFTKPACWCPSAS